MNFSDRSTGTTNGQPSQSDVAARFTARWHLIGAGLSNVWRFGDLELPAASGRLLLRGTNGTGKTTALEALAPYLLDLNAARMSAGKARTTNLSSLMREGATGKRRCGYAWLTLAEQEEGIWSFGVRMQYSEGASPPVKVVPFAVPGRPLHELKLYGMARAPIASEQFAENVHACGGQIFDSEEAYVAHLAVRLFGTPDRAEIAMLAARLRQVRNPTLLGDVSPQAAADALRESLPGVAEEVISATADALAESDATRDAFTRDKQAAEILDDFRAVWSAHATEVVATSHSSAVEAGRELRAQLSRVKARSSDLSNASAEADQAMLLVEKLESDIASAKSEIAALEKHQAYKDAGRLTELKKSAAAQSQAAESAAQLMQVAASGAASECESLRRELENIKEDLEEYRNEARKADAAADSDAPLLTWALRKRASLRAGDIVAEPGPELVIHGNSALLRDAASSWLQLAEAHASQADAASLAIIDHKPVEVLQQASDEKARAARDAAATADAEFAEAKRAEVVAQQAGHGLIVSMRAWTESHPQLTEPLASSTEVPTSQISCGAPWSLEEVEQIADGEPGQVLATCDAWARHAMARAEGIAGELRGRAKQAMSDASTAREEARRLRDEAEELRSGRLLPLPRPEWAGPGDDSVALGAVLDWQDIFENAEERSLLEAAMGAAGLLGASVGQDGASTRFWRVEPTGPIFVENLSELITVDVMHPLASAAAAVLARVRVAPSAAMEDEVSEVSALCIGRDGTFRAGVLRGRVSGPDDPAPLAPASHIGARQRRAAALAHAEALDEQAAQLEADAASHEKAAARLEQNADAVSALGQTVPSREELRAAESRRVEMSRIARNARDAATAAQRESEHAARQQEHAHREWVGRTRSRGLPDDLDQLVLIRDHGTERAQKLRAAAAPLRGKLADRLDSVVARYSAEQITRRLTQTEADAQQAFRIAMDTKTGVRVLEETAGTAIADVLARHEETNQRLSLLEGQHGPARQKQIDTAKDQAKAQANLDQAETKLRAEVQPRAARELVELRALLAVPGIADAVLDGDLVADDGTLLDHVASKLHGRKTLTTKTVLERADAARAKLAGIWSLDPGDTHGKLLTFVLTHRDTTFTPIEAAAHSERLKMRAEQALAASEERALREFVVGRMPTAIGTAWTRLQDWVVEVNRKMRSAAASSGVGVQVRIPLREDLAPASRDVYELSCNVSSAERAPEQERRLSDALQALLAAAQGETMQERVASAVDIREWVEVLYEVTRPGGTKHRWSSKTGLSDGERRLVVLAPMLAAIAAGYDRFGSKVPRLVTLDEVPAEVDERGREGLARYIAELDLDLVCTSYLWDGCPGAWDGIDAHDLEAGLDGTVVAFPMLVRGLSPIPEVDGSKIAGVERVQ